MVENKKTDSDIKENAAINRITKVVKGGRRLFCDLVVVGNQKGSVGISRKIKTST